MFVHTPFQQIRVIRHAETSRKILEEAIVFQPNTTIWKTIRLLFKQSDSTPRRSRICSSQRRRPVGDFAEGEDLLAAELMEVIKEAGVTNGCDRAIGNLL